MTAPTVVDQLVERLHSHREAYRSGQYNEAQLREEFLNPFFEALGWDIYNKRGYAEAYKEVIHEAAIKVGGRTKAPDYCFRAGGGVRSFFVEAKKPAVDIREAVSPAYQLRRYAWSAKLPVSVLTDFKEWAVYDCRIRPVKTDRASGRYCAEASVGTSPRSPKRKRAEVAATGRARSSHIGPFGAKLFSISGVLQHGAVRFSTDFRPGLPPLSSSTCLLPPASGKEPLDTVLRL